MKTQEPGIYHIYNRGNNQQPIFFNEDNYIYFLNKCHQYLKPVGEMLAWCLMKNHFHFLMEVTPKSMVPVKSGGITMPVITNGIRLLLSSYSQGVNKQQKRTGNLFQQKTKAKLVSDNEYLLIAFLYIHQNPVKATYVNAAEDWKYSSAREYRDPSTDNLCNTKRAMELLNLSSINFQSVLEDDEEKIKSIF